MVEPLPASTRKPEGCEVVVLFHASLLLHLATHRIQKQSSLFKLRLPATPVYLLMNLRIFR